MSQNSATGNKRVRIDPTATVSTESTAIKTNEITAPRSLAASFVCQHTSSLHPQVAPILEHMGLAHIHSLAKLHNKSLQVSKMEPQADFIPRSARVDFKLFMSTEAKSTAEFDELNATTTAYLLEVQQKLKEKVIAATKIEIRVLLKQVLHSFAKSLRIAVEAFLISNAPSASAHPVDDFVKELLRLHGNDLVKHLNSTAVRF